jgi:hypothetical protein
VILTELLPGELGILNPQVRALMRARCRPIDPCEPSANIHVLAERLQREHSGSYLYRGQVRHYPAMVPSIYRRAIDPGTEGDPIIAIDSQRFDSLLSSRDFDAGQFQSTL